MISLILAAFPALESRAEPLWSDKLLVRVAVLQDASAFEISIRGRYQILNPTNYGEYVSGQPRGVMQEKII